MLQILSSEPTETSDGYVQVSYENRRGWSESMGAHILPIMLGDELAGPLLVLSYVPPMQEQMPLSFAHAHASDNWRISIRGTTNMGRDAYAKGEWRFHDGGVPYASDNFAWGPDGGYGIIVFGDRRGFAIEPVKAEIAEKITPQEHLVGQMLGIDMQSPCPGAPAIATTMGSTTRAHLDGGFASSGDWPEAAPGVRIAAGLFGEPECGPVLVFVDAAAGTEVLPARSLGAETLVAPVSGSVTAGDESLGHGEVRVEERDTSQPALVAGPDGAQVVILVADRRALHAAVDAQTFAGAVANAVAPTVGQLQRQLVTN